MLKRLSMSKNVGMKDNLKGGMGEFVARRKTRIQNIYYLHNNHRGL